MSLDVDDHKAATSPRPSRRWRWIAVAAAIVVVAVVLAVVLSQRGGSDTAPPPADTGGHAGVAPLGVLQVPAAGGRCMVPSAGLLAQRPVAFEGRVSALGAHGATLTVDHRFAGKVADSVVVRPGPRTTEPGLRFAAGRTYLLAAATDGTVAVCGLSGEKTPALARMYAAAFGG